MKVLFIYTGPIERNSGGVQRMTSLIGEYLQEQGSQVYYLSAKSKKGCIDNYYLPNLQRADTNDNLIYVDDLVKNNQIDLIINQAGIVPDIVRLVKQVKINTNVRVITCFHNSIFGGVINYGITHKKQLDKIKIGWISPFFSFHLAKSFLKKQYIKNYRQHYLTAYKSSDRIVLLSETMKAELEDMVGTDITSKVVIIPNFIQKPEPYNETKANEVIYVGRIDRLYKRTELVIKIWSKVHKQNPSWTLRIVGEGEDLEYLKTLASKLHVENVIFEGKQNPIPYYKKARILMMTSCSESFGLVLVEAMSYGVVPIAFNAFQNIKDIINEENDGILVKPFLLQSFAEKLNGLMNNPELVDTMSKSAIVKATSFFESNILSLWRKELYQN